MAPEQALGRPVSPATDVFALGALIAYVASGEAPFGAGPESTALYRVVHEQPDLTHVPHDLRDLLAWCLAKRPEERPTTVDLIAAVQGHPLVGPRPEFAEGWLPQSISDQVAGRIVRPAPVHAQPTFAAPAAPPPPPGTDIPVEPSSRRARRGRRRPVVVTALAALAILMAAGGAVYLLGSPEWAWGSAGDSAADSGPSSPSYVPGGRRSS